MLKAKSNLDHDDKKSVDERKDNVSADKRKMSVAVPKKGPGGVMGAKQMQALSGPSLTGLLATKRIFKKFSMKGRQRSVSSVTVPQKHYEPTYRMEPKKRFNPSLVEDIVQNVLHKRLNGLHYNKKFAPAITKTIGQILKEQVKALRFERYKIICIILLGEDKEQSMVATSRCSWDPRTDTFATYTFRNMDLYCTATVYGVYRE